VVAGGLVPFVWVCGPSGVGKSTIGWEVYRQLVGTGATAAYVDLDQIGFCRPAPSDDPENHRMSALNLAAVWPNYRVGGADSLVASGIVHSREQIRMHASAVPDTTMTVCRLRASHETLRARILRRGAGGGPPLPGDEVRGQMRQWLEHAADDSIREAVEMDRNELGDLCLDTDGMSIDEVARQVLVLTGLDRLQTGRQDGS
jgi:predicted ABC-type ATPase